MATRDDRRAALLLLLLALAGVGVRMLLSGDAPAGGVAYRAADGVRPAQDSVAARARRLARPVQPGERIDLDRAAAEELTRLPRIGPALAARIVADRAAHGPFRSLDALERVSGIGPATVEALKPYATFSGALTVPSVPSVPSAPRGGGAAVGQPVSLNTATADELTQLPGIGPVKAQAIVEDRQRRGPYRTLQDLMRVPGIGPATIARLADRVRIP